MPIRTTQTVETPIAPIWSAATDSLIYALTAATPTSSIMIPLRRRRSRPFLDGCLIHLTPLNPSSECPYAHFTQAKRVYASHEISVGLNKLIRRNSGG
ncbi:hypothetical protein LA080_013032 [Diaporthe eres]|nr:hypothetical protein LA080_013032 [Diaporthe eres]